MDEAAYINEVDEGVADVAVICEVWWGGQQVVDSVAFFDLPMRRYMKSYSPRLVSSRMSFSICESILLGMLRNMICNISVAVMRRKKNTHSCANVHSTFDLLDDDLIVVAIGIVPITTSTTTRWRAED